LAVRVDVRLERQPTEGPDYRGLRLIAAPFLLDLKRNRLKAPTTGDCDSTILWISPYC